jgi:hypothetical protein
MDTSLQPESEVSKNTQKLSPRIIIDNGINENSKGPLNKTLSEILIDNSNHIDIKGYNSFGNRTLKKRSLSLPTNKINAPLNKTIKDKSMTIANQTHKSSIIKSSPLSSIESDSEIQIGIHNNIEITEGIKDSSNGELNGIKGHDVPNDHKLSNEIHVSLSKDELKVPLSPILCPEVLPSSIEYPIITGHEDTSPSMDDLSCHTPTLDLEVTSKGNNLRGEEIGTKGEEVSSYVREMTVLAIRVVRSECSRAVLLNQQAVQKAVIIGLQSVPSSYKPNNRQFPPKVFNPMQRPQPPPTFLRRHHTITSSSEDMEGGRDHGHRGLTIYPAPGPVTGRGFDRNFQPGYGGNPNPHLFMGNMHIGGYGGRGGDGNRWEVMSDEGGSTPQWQGQRSRESDDVYTQPLPIGLPFYPQKPTKPGSFIESRSIKPVSASEKKKAGSFSQPTKPVSSPEPRLPIPLSETVKLDFCPEMSKPGSFYKPNIPLGSTQGSHEYVFLIDFILHLCCSGWSVLVWR